MEVLHRMDGHMGDIGNFLVLGNEKNKTFAWRFIYGKPGVGESDILLILARG